MNRYVVDGLLGDALKGKRILFVGENHSIARHAFELVSTRAIDLLGRPALKIRRTKGEERVAVGNGGGLVRFVSYRSSSHRGLSVDVVYLNSERMDLDDYLPMLARVASGEVMWP